MGVAGITLMGAGTFGSPAGVFAADRTPATGGAASCASDQECVQPTAVPSSGDQAGCSGIAGLLKADSLDSSDSYWHFVIPSSEGYEFAGAGFDATFNGADTEFTVNYVQQRKDGGYKGVVVEADGGATLGWAWVPESAIMDESAEAEGSGAEDSNGNGDFVLSGTCAGDATSSGTTSSTNQTTTSTQSSTSSTQSSTGTTQSSTGSTESSTSSTQSSTGTTQSSTGSTQSSTGSTQNTTSSTESSSSQTTSSSNTSSSSTPTTSTSKSTTSSQSSNSQTSTGQTTVVTDPSSSTSSASSSSSSSASTPSAGVLGASTTTPSTGADIEFGLGIALLLGGAGVTIGATRIKRNKRS